MRTFNLLGLSAATVMSAALCCAPLASAAAPAADSAPRTDGQRKEVLDLVAKTTQISPVDLTQGSSFAVANDLYRDNHKVGQGGVTCTIVRTDQNSGEMQCLGTLSLAKGDITIQGLRFFAQSPADFDMAITGGTGAYSDSSGWVHGHALNETDTQLTFHISHVHAGA